MAAVTATVADSTWFLPFWTVSRPVPSASIPIMAKSRAARRCAVSADSIHPRSHACAAGGPLWTSVRAPAWEPGPGCAPLDRLGNHRVESRIVGLSPPGGGVKVGDDRAGLLDSGDGPAG